MTMSVGQGAHAKHLTFVYSLQSQVLLAFWQQHVLSLLVLAQPVSPLAITDLTFETWPIVTKSCSEPTAKLLTYVNNLS